MGAADGILLVEDEEGDAVHPDLLRGVDFVQYHIAIGIDDDTGSTRLPMTNIFDEFEGKIRDSPNHELLDQVNVVDADSGTLLADYEKHGSAWKRVR